MYENTNGNSNINGFERNFGPQPGGGFGSPYNGEETYGDPSVSVFGSDQEETISHTPTANPGAGQSPVQDEYYVTAPHQQRQTYEDDEFDDDDDFDDEEDDDDDFIRDDDEIWGQPTKSRGSKKKRQKQQRDESFGYDRGKKKKKRTGKKGGGGLLKALIFCAFAIVLVIQGADRIESAQALVGSTQLPTGGSTSIDLDLSGDNDVDQTGSEAGDVEGNQTISEYRYIDVKRLEEKTPTDLAVWYLGQFGDGAVYNDIELDEFSDWYNKRVTTDPEFHENFEAALLYIKEHPEVLTPSEPVTEPEDEEPDPSETPDATQSPESGSSSSGNTNTGTGNQSSTENTGNSSSNGQGSTSTGNQDSQTSTPSASPEPSEAVDPYPYIDQDALNEMSAAGAANWAVENFNKAGLEGYQIQSDFWNWLSTKSAAFQEKVKGFIESMGTEVPG